MSALSKYKTYPEYKDSGVEWLGKIPSHWEAKRLSNFFIERREKVSDKDYPALSVTKLGIVPQLETAAKTDAGDNRKLVLKNDFVINSRSDRKGSSGTSPYNGSVSLISIVLEPKNILPKFAHHLLRSIPFQEEFYRFGKGIVADLWSTNSSEMKNILLPELDKIEQAKIAQFLDHETAKIDQLIEKQQTLIELLKEKRQAVISRAVTKGLDPNVKMKDSGVEWLGEVPEHWNISRLGFESLIKARLGWKGLKAEEYVEQGYIFLATPNIKSGDIDFENVNYITQKRYEESPEIMLKKGDVLVTKDGSTTGTTNIVRNLPSPATVNSSIAVIRPQSSLHSEYLYYYFISPYTQNVIKRMQGGMGVPHLFQADLRVFNLILPPTQEQIEIATYLDNRTSKIDLLIQKAEQQIELMKERRTALISAAVTGKIDVRDWQPEQ
ncbi:restriction endonuclease subunit S [Wohlfahrtiimonas chitiniclastica]|uniref:restriction endonuclease subunit S n=1 Tax=Wohlfahrtiimonas chitiniclastica TaxID=400946 RepID=UPI0007B69BAC|nr:restriction endonuclease subunit S [Wohlfahrtiimonas chitiniclastica]KZX37291.1 restriction endonuclease subunit S [Wohlfahrtiimonas chitiniclastica]